MSLNKKKINIFCKYKKKLKKNYIYFYFDKILFSQMSEFQDIEQIYD